MTSGNASARVPTGGPSLEDACAVVRAGLARAAVGMRGLGLPVPEPRGKLLRPVVAWAVLPPDHRARVDDRFWLGALAIQMVHEASLLHDDIVDDAATRRGEATLVSTRGVGAAVVQGDHLLTAAYRVAAAADIPGFLPVFVRAVERTVAGEIAQHRGAGRALTPAEYRAAIEGKSGELFGAAVALARAWSGEAGGALGEAEGRRVGALYQMVDDALDYCPSTDTGKPALQDYGQKKWTFVLQAAGLDGFDLDAAAVVSRLFSDAEGAAGSRIVAELEEERSEVLRALAPGDELLAAITGEWVAMARDAYARERSRTAPPRAASPAPASAEAEVVELARAVGGPEAWGRYFGVHSKSFRFAARLFPPEPRRSVEGVYAFCRFTDDLVDEADVEPARARDRLQAWRSLVTEAYEGSPTGVPLADHVMGEAARRGVPRHYADDLLTGVAMDLEPLRFETGADLEIYTYRVASVVGGWITESFGVRDPEVLSRAYALGHAMQITNILRDVGEDWRDERLYLPHALLRTHGLGPDDVDRVAYGRGPLPDAWADLCEDLMAEADEHYARAFAALPVLPSFYARPVAVAARVYQGIHDRIRANGYDNGTRRAFTRLPTKIRLGLGGLLDLRRSRATPAPGAGRSRLVPHNG